MTTIAEALSHEFYGATIHVADAEKRLKQFEADNFDVLAEYHTMKADVTLAKSKLDFVRKLARRVLPKTSGDLPPVFERIRRNAVAFYGETAGYYGEPDEKEEHKALFDAAFKSGFKWLFKLNMPKLEQFVRDNVQNGDKTDVVAKYLPDGLDEMLPAYVRVEDDIRFHEDKAAALFEAPKTYYFMTDYGGKRMTMDEALELDEHIVIGVTLIDPGLDDIPF